MRKSMTGYAYLARVTDDYDIFIEIKSLNSKYFEFKLKSNYQIDEWENEIKNLIFEKIKRGKLELYIKIFEKTAQNFDLIINYELAKKFEASVLALSKEINLIPEITIKDLFAFGDIIQIERNELNSSLLSLIKEMLNELLNKLLDMMYIEGKKICDDISISLDLIKNSLTKIQELYPISLEKYKNQLKERIKELIPENLDPNLINNRLLMEVELVASRSAINEEITRLDSHLHQFYNILNNEKEGDSKKLDFIAQEMNREANTIASKSFEYSIIENTILIKGEIEKIREHLRNLE